MKLKGDKIQYYETSEAPDFIKANIEFMIYIPAGQEKNFTIDINHFKCICPVKIKFPDGFILPGSLLTDKETLQVCPELRKMKLIFKNNIEFITENNP